MAKVYRLENLSASLEHATDDYKTDDSHALETSAVIGTTLSFCAHCVWLERVTWIETCFDRMSFLANTYYDGNQSRAIQALIDEAPTQGLNPMCVEESRMFDVSNATPNIRIDTKFSAHINKPLLSPQQSNHRPLKCQDVRGVHGEWIQDWEFAKQTRYDPGQTGRHPEIYAERRFKPTNETPTRWANSWRWQDSNHIDKDLISGPEAVDNTNMLAGTSGDDNCSVTPLFESPLEQWCRVCNKLNVTQVLFLGDSLSRLSSMSLRGLLGFPPNVPKWPFFFQPFKVPCEKERFEISIQYGKGSHMDDWKSLLVAPSKTDTEEPFRFHRLMHNSNAFSKRNITTTNRPTGRTAILANIGAWESVNDMPNFKIAFHLFTDWVDRLDPDRAIVFYRDTTTGHWPCNPPGDNIEKEHRRFNFSSTMLQVAPHRSYDEFEQNFTAKFGWENFFEHNEYARSYIHSRQREMTLAADSDNGNDNRDDRELKKKTMIHYLNVFNMTVLRRDGLVGWGDCLHYSIPGPMDWWVHTWYFALLEMASAEEE
jgi:hypothetical protein